MSIDYIITHLGMLKMAIDMQIAQSDGDTLKASRDALAEAQLLLASMKIREEMEKTK